MRKRMGWAAGAALVVSAWSGTALAQDGGERTHDGFFLRLGLDFGPLILNEEGEGLGEADYSGLHVGSDLLLGGTPVDGLVIGGFLTAARTSDPTVKAGGGEATLDGTLIFAGIGAFVSYYLDPQQGFHLQGRFGFAALDFITDDGRSGGNDPTGIMLGLGAGYDFWIGSEWSVGPFARVLYAPLSSESGGVTVDYTYIFPSIGAAFTYH